jgi:hypothetical protein
VNGNKWHPREKFLQDYLVEMLAFFDDVARASDFTNEQREANVWPLLIEALGI